MLKYKLICVDMDRTLLNSKKEITRKSLDAIKKAHELGVKLVIATGRIFVSAGYYGDLIGVKAPIIASNGAYVREKDGEKVIFEEYLSMEECSNIVSILKEYNIVPHFYSFDTIYTSKIIHSSLAYKNANAKLPQNRQVKIEVIDDWEKLFLKRPKLIKTMAVDDDGDKVLQAKERFLSLDKFEVVSSFSKSFEVMPRGTSKGNAVKKICEYYGVHPSEVIAIGDNENDISMIEYAGLGIAMGNSEEKVKDIADYITESNDRDGVAMAIEKFILDDGINFTEK